nr:class A beta-lactamase [Siccirubricoccus sp. G192]
MAGLTLAGRMRGARAAGDVFGALPATLARIEAASGGRLGVAVLDTLTDTRSGHRTDERFPMCSTFKLLAAGAVLARADAGRERLDRRIRFGRGDLVVYSPVTQERVGGDGMSLAELCAAAMTLSDNTAGNLLLASMGGPAGLTAYLRSLGDTVTRLDRIEPELNEAIPDDPRDTTTPAAMLANLQALALGPALSAGSREQLVGWLLGNRTGDTRLRAGLPDGWRTGDKTGSGGEGHGERRRHPLAARARTSSRRRLSHRNACHRGTAQCDDCRGRPGRGGRNRRLGPCAGTESRAPRDRQAAPAYRKIRVATAIW